MPSARRGGPHRRDKKASETTHLRASRYGGQAAIIVVAGLIAYANIFSSPLLFDDFSTIVRNPQITDIGNLSALFSPQADGPLAGRPLVNVAFALNLAAAGPNVAAFHAVNLALHLACGLLLFGVVRRTLELPAISRVFPWAPVNSALAVALLWTVHPLNSEVVNYTTQRSESMMAACYLLALYATARSLESRASRWWVPLSVLAVLTGTLCKETIATAPLLILIYDRAFGFNSYAVAFRARWRFYAALAATWVPLGLMVALNGQSFAAGFSSAQASAIQYFLNQPEMLTHYLWLTIWPKSLVLYYGWPRAVTMAQVWPYFAFITALFIVALVTLIRRPRIGVLGAAVFLTLGPTSSIILIATEVGAERRMYLASAALIILAVAAVAWVLKQMQPSNVPRHAAVVLLVVVSSALAVRTMLRNREYASALTMAQTVLDRWPSPNAHYLVGVELAAAGRRDEAIARLQEASHGYPAALYYLGQELFKAGRFDETVAALRGFVAAEPNVAAVRPARILTARALEAANKPADAIRELTTMVTGSAGEADVHALLANMYAGQQAFAQAVPHYVEYLKARPQDGDGWTGLGIAFINLGKQPEAVEAFRNAVNAQPGNAQFRANLERAMGRD